MSSGSSRSRERGRADQIDEHHRQLPPLGLKGRGRRAYDCQEIRRRCGLRRKGSDRLRKLPARAQRDTEFLEVLVSQLSQDLGLDFAIPEHLRIALQPQLTQPSRNIHKRPHRDGNRGAKATSVTDWRPAIRARRFPYLPGRSGVPRYTAALGSRPAVSGQTRRMAVARDVPAGRPVHRQAAPGARDDPDAALSPAGTAGAGCARCAGWSRTR